MSLTQDERAEYDEDMWAGYEEWLAEQENSEATERTQLMTREKSGS